MTKVNNMIEHTIHYEDDKKRQMAVLDEKISESRKKLNQLDGCDQGSKEGPGRAWLLVNTDCDAGQLTLCSYPVNTKHIM